MLRRHLLLSLILIVSCFSLFAEEENQESAQDEFHTIELPEDLVALPSKETIQEAGQPIHNQDKYLEAYIQGLLDAKFSKYSVDVTVRNGQVLLSHLPEDRVKSEKIITFVKKFSSIQPINQNLTIPIAAELPALDVKEEKKQRSRGIWFPQSTVLYPTEVANPRHVAFSAGHRMGDKVCGGNHGSAVQFGDQFPLYRWANMWKWRGDLQLELEAGVFAVFCHDTSSSPLQNADYYVGIPLSYAVGPWAFRSRVYHISSHLGDEFIGHNKHACRKNKSFEAVDFSTSYQMNDILRLFGRLGAVVHSDSEMHIDPWYLEYGLEARAWRHNFTQLYGQPFLALYFRNMQETNYRFDSSIAIGYEWGKIQGFGRKVRTYLGYYNGFSNDGQFSRKKTQYTALTLEYGF